VGSALPADRGRPAAPTDTLPQRRPADAGHVEGKWGGPGRNHNSFGIAGTQSTDRVVLRSSR